MTHNKGEPERVPNSPDLPCYFLGQFPAIAARTAAAKPTHAMMPTSFPDCMGYAGRGSYDPMKASLPVLFKRPPPPFWADSEGQPNGQPED